MSGSIASIEKAGSASWLHTLAGTANYEIYKDGAVYDDNWADTEIIIEDDNTTPDLEEPPQIEVLDSTDTATPQQLLYPPNLELQWHRVTGAGVYVIERYISAAWTEIARVGADDYAEYLRYRTGVLADGTTHQFRVKAIDERGYSSDYVAFSVFQVCTPDVPRITATYNAVGPAIDFTARA